MQSLLHITLPNHRSKVYAGGVYLFGRGDMNKLFVLISVLLSIGFTVNKGHSIDYWAIHYAENEIGLARCVKQVSTNEYIVAGFTGGVGYDGRIDIWMLNLDGSGNINWQKTYNGAGNDEDYPASIQLTTDGGYIVVGDSWLGITFLDTIWVLKFDNNGDIIWQKSYTGGVEFALDSPTCVRQTADGGYIVSGYTGSFGVVSMMPGC